MNTTYVLYSEILDRYYIGSTRNPIEERLSKHLSKHDGFTTKAKDWKIVFKEHFEQYEQALEKEKLIKSWKSRRMIEKLINCKNL